MRRCGDDRQRYRDLLGVQAGGAGGSIVKMTSFALGHRPQGCIRKRKTAQNKKSHPLSGGFFSSGACLVVETATDEEHTAFEVLGGGAHLFFCCVRAQLFADERVALVEVRFEERFAFLRQCDIDDTAVCFARYANDQLFFGETVDDRRHLLFGDGDLFGERTHVVGAEMLEHDKRAVVVRAHRSTHVVDEIFVYEDEYFEQALREFIMWLLSVFFLHRKGSFVFFLLDCIAILRYI